MLKPQEEKWWVEQKASLLLFTFILLESNIGVYGLQTNTDFDQLLIDLEKVYLTLWASPKSCSWMNWLFLALTFGISVTISYYYVSEPIVKWLVFSFCRSVSLEFLFNSVCTSFVPCCYKHIHILNPVTKVT